MPEDTTEDDTAELSDTEDPERPEPRRFEFTISRTVEREYHPTQIRDICNMHETGPEHALQEIEVKEQMDATDPAELLKGLQVEVEEVGE
jgi:hypothetical protein